MADHTNTPDPDDFEVEISPSSEIPDGVLDAVSQAEVQSEPRQDRTSADSQLQSTNVQARSSTDGARVLQDQRVQETLAANETAQVAGVADAEAQREEERFRSEEAADQEAAAFEAELERQHEEQERREEEQERRDAEQREREEQEAREREEREEEEREREEQQDNGSYYID
jgi:colicin import membrane protein